MDVSSENWYENTVDQDNDDCDVDVDCDDSGRDCIDDVVGDVVDCDEEEGRSVDRTFVVVAVAAAVVVVVVAVVGIPHCSYRHRKWTRREFGHRRVAIHLAKCARLDDYFESTNVGFSIGVIEWRRMMMMTRMIVRMMRMVVVAVSEAS